MYTGVERIHMHALCYQPIRALVWKHPKMPTAFLTTAQIQGTKKEIIKCSVPCPDCVPQDYIHICPLISKFFVDPVDLARSHLLLNLT